MTTPTKRLVLFATSENPDPYINVICYCMTNNIATSVDIVTVSNHAYSNKDTKTGRATRILERVLTQLRALSEGNYLTFKTGNLPSTMEPLKDAEGRKTYSTVLESIERGKITAMTIPHSDLFPQLRQWITSGAVVFDVTALQKNLLVDVVSTSLLLAFYDVYSFELLKEHVTYGQDDLFYSLKIQQDFTYRNLFKSEPVQKAQKRLNRWRIQAKIFSWLAFGMLLSSVLLIIFGPKDSVLYYISLVSSLLSIVTALLPFVREKFEQ